MEAQAQPQTCGLFSPLLPEQRGDAEELEAVWLKSQASLPLHIPDCRLCRRLSSLYASHANVTTASACLLQWYIWSWKVALQCM